MTTVVLEGGSRDGESTSVDDGIDRLLAASAAPGLLDIYEPTGLHRHLPGNQDQAEVFAFVGQEPIGDLAPQAIHMPMPE
jgi:hypothetical protein